METYAGIDLHSSNNFAAIHGEWSLFCEERLIWEKC